MKIEHLVATVNSDGISLYKRMKLKTDAIIANQCKNKFSTEKHKINNSNIKIINTTTIGVGINRNIALSQTDSDICILSDDDMAYKDDYIAIIKKAYDELPKADVIIFNIETIGAQMGRRTNKKIKKINSFNYMNYGAARITFRTNKIIASNIWFTKLFGGGAKYSSGEDTVFLADALKNKLKVYVYPKTIAKVRQEKSSWFSSYNDKFYFDKGALLCKIHPHTKYLYAYLYFPYRFKGTQNISVKRSLLLAGIESYKYGIDYLGWKRK